MKSLNRGPGSRQNSAGGTPALPGDGAHGFGNVEHTKFFQPPRRQEREGDFISALFAFFAADLFVSFCALRGLIL
jgi:hypothetical protein